MSFTRRGRGQGFHICFPGPLLKLTTPRLVMALGFLFSLLTNVFGYVSLLAGAVSIACGLYCAAELAEEHSAIARKMIVYTLYGQAVIHVMLTISGVPLFTTFLSGASQLVYCSLLPAFPFVEPLSMSSIGSMMAIVLSHVAWFNFFYSNYVPVFEVTGLFLAVIWCVPLMFFVSLSVGDEALPIGSGGQRVGSRTGGSSNAFKAVYDMVHDMVEQKIKKTAPGINKRS